MKFQALYYADRLHYLHVKGDIGIITLWSPVSQVLKKLTEWQLDLSRVAVLGNLYGNGLPQLLRNLLYNPQIVHLVILGQDLSNSRQELINFFQLGIEPVEYCGTPTFRIKGTQRIIDGEVTPTDFLHPIQLHPFGKLTECQHPLQEFLQQLPSPLNLNLPRQEKPLSTFQPTHYPSHPQIHTIYDLTPLLAWQSLVTRLLRFGKPIQLKKGKRYELLNVKAIIEQGTAPPTVEVEQFGFNVKHIMDYQSRLLQAELGEQTYTYGNRLRGYFAHQSQLVDGLAAVIQRLQTDPNTRHAYLSLWDGGRDTVEGRGCPCLVSLFFRLSEEKLNLTANFRTHNAMDAWLENAFGLGGILNYVAQHSNLSAGNLTLISHSISLSEEVMNRAKAVPQPKSKLRLDPHGEVNITWDEQTQEVVVQHSYQGANLGEYRGKTSLEIESQLVENQVISDISHALYIGREIAKQFALQKK